MWSVCKKLVKITFGGSNTNEIEIETVSIEHAVGNELTFF
jgi:hypothetical protein